MFRRLLPLALSFTAFPLVSYAQPLPDRAPIKGTVVDEAGRPVTSAVLTVRRQNDMTPTAFWGAEARVDESGRFVIPEAEEGSYFFNVDAPGFASIATMAFDWTAKSQPVRLQLSRLSRLTLRILTSEGKPLVQAPVWIRLRDQNNQTPVRAVTNLSGEVVVPNIAPSSYSLIVVAQNGSAVQGAFAFNSAQKAPIEARLREGATLRISAKDADGMPVGGASLYMFAQTPEEATRLAGDGGDPGENWALVAAANAPQALVSRDADGTLELKHIPAGKFSARLTLPGFGLQTREFSLADGQIAEWKADFPARRSAKLSLLVRDAGGQPVANAPVALRLLPLAQNGTFDEGMNVMGDLPGGPDGNIASSGMGARIAMTDESGRVNLFPLMAGNYRIFASRWTENGWLRAPVAPEGSPSDVVVSLTGSNTGVVQVP